MATSATQYSIYLVTLVDFVVKYAIGLGLDLRWKNISFKLSVAYIVAHAKNIPPNLNSFPYL